MALLPLLLNGCGGNKEPVKELPPPTGEEQTDAPGGGDIQGGAGVEATPLGKGWTSTQIDNGVLYHVFNGTDEITGYHQEVFVIDVDLNNPAYQVKLVYESPRLATSAAFKKQTKAIAAINANYEPTSIYMRVNGTNVYTLQNDIINGTNVPNWKSEAAVSFSGDSNVKFLWAGSQKKGEVTVDQQRQYYKALSATEYPSFISSAPMLINNYEKVGENFCDYSISTSSSYYKGLSSEHPDKHQRTLHPRTAIGLTKDNHLILLCVDGRIKSYGMGARSLTRFMVKWFNPQYALNLDGGGSTTMCVKGEGDASTNVVNYPCDGNKNYDHTGERSRDAFIMVLKK